jgi:adenylate cyclase
MFSGIISFWDTGLYDLCMNIRVLTGQGKQNPLIANIDLNDSSVELLGSQLDTRQAFANVMEVLGRTNTSVILDFLFRYERDNDTAFVNAMKSTVNPVIAVLAVDKNFDSFSYRELNDSERKLIKSHLWNINVKRPGSIPEARTFLLPFGALGAAASQLAHINMEPDTDGIYRRVPLLYRWDDGFIPSLPLAAAVLELGFPVESIELDAGHYLTLSYSEKEKVNIPIDEKGNMLIPYTNTWAESRRISLHTIVEAKNDPVIFNSVSVGLAGHIALIAEISTVQKDFGPTSFERLFPLSGVHASVLSGILNGFEKRSFIGIPSMPFKFFIIVMIITAAFFCVKARKDMVFHFGFLFTVLIFTAITIYRWFHAAIAPWYAFPAVLLFFLWIISFLYRLAARYHEQELLKNALSRYFPRALAERILRERKTDLIPAYKELTVLFSDISGFTKWSSAKSPEQVHNFLSDYLESMAAILFSCGGTVDKFMGDGILAFFGDPFEMPDHCERCIRAAIAMQKRIISLAEKWRHIVEIDLKVRIGINTGKVIVGNLGSKTRIEYTVIGAAVNLAQRMESNAPVGGILVTADVREKVKDIFSFGEKRQVVVKGYEETIEAYEVCES